MPYKKPTIEKIHYSISEVAKIFNVNQSLLRYWEKEFPSLIKPYKNKKGNRYYTKEDIDSIAYIYHLVKEKGFTIEGAKQFLKKHNEQTINQQTIILAKLQNIKQQLLEIKQKIKELNNEQQKQE